MSQYFSTGNFFGNDFDENYQDYLLNTIINTRDGKKHGLVKRILPHGKIVVELFDKLERF